MYIASGDMFWSDFSEKHPFLVKNDTILTQKRQILTKKWWKPLLYIQFDSSVHCLR
jgi:hypothetical protein